MTIPSLGLGMRSIPENSYGKAIIQSSLDSGYRLFDTSPKYHNEKMLGDVIRDSNIDRQEIFVITKIGIETIVKGDPFILDSIESSLNNLNIDYIDLLLLEHSVNKYNVNAWDTLINVQQNMFDNLKNKIKAIGVSNYSIRDINELIQMTNVPPMFHQYEVSPFLQNQQMAQFCTYNKIKIISHTSIANYTNITHNTIKALCLKRNVTPSQLMIRWGVQRGYAVLVGTGNIDHLEENMDISKFCLSFHDYEFMNKMNDDKSFAVFIR